MQLVDCEQQGTSVLRLGSAIILYNFSQRNFAMLQTEFQACLDSPDTFVFIITRERTPGHMIFEQLKIFDLQ